MRRVAAGGGVFKGENGTKVHIPGANLNDIANQADDLLEVNMLKDKTSLTPTIFMSILSPLRPICDNMLARLALQTMESRPVIPDRKLLARLVLIREEARDMMGGGILDERNDRGFSTLPESEVYLTSFIH